MPLHLGLLQGLPCQEVDDNGVVDCWFLPGTCTYFIRWPTAWEGDIAVGGVGVGAGGGGVGVGGVSDVGVGSAGVGVGDFGVGLDDWCWYCCWWMVLVLVLLLLLLLLLRCYDHFELTSGASAARSCWCNC